GSVVAGVLEPLVEGAGLVHPDRVRVGDVEYLAGLCHVAGQARLAEPQGLGLEALLQLGPGQLPLDQVVLHHREPEPIAVAKEERPGLGAREAPRRLEDPVEQGVEIALAGDGEPDVEELVQHLLALDGGVRAHGAAARLRPRRLASESARPAATKRSWTS